jgi:ribosome biogenesis protein SSF1/2
MVKKRTKKRTHLGAPGRAPVPGSAPVRPGKPGDRTPKSMVIRIGASDVGPSVSQLVKDVRSMMEPATATRLKERKSNKLRDYISMAGPLGVSHLLLFSRSENGNVQLRMAVTPRGPTLCFRVEKYSLCKDVHKSMKRPKTANTEYLTSPLLVMNNFSSAQGETEETKDKKNIPKHLESLTTTIFQSLFPPINPTTTPLKSINRIMLLDRSPDDANTENPSYVLNLRHFAIETKTAKSVPKALRKLDAAEKLKAQSGKRNRGGLPNLGKLDDVADYLLDPQDDGFTSGSDSEPDTDAEVDILEDDPRRVMSKAQHKKRQEELSDRRDPARKVERRGIKMHELGPRMRLRLTKVEEGLCTGKVMWHEYIHKTAAELKEMDRVHAKRRQEKERRKAEQKANVEKKKAERKASGKHNVEGEDDDDDEIVGEAYDSDDDQWQDDDMENAEEADEDEEMEDDMEEEE